MTLKSILFLSLFAFAFVFHTVAQEKPHVKIGGALRFNYNLSDWKKGQEKRGGDFGFDLFRINAEAEYKKVFLNAEYRFYSKSFGGGMLKQGWIGYRFNEKNDLQVGLSQVPFGITQYDSHNWFFGINYYLGLEDDHDMGVKFTHKGEKIDYALAFYKNSEDLNLGSNVDVSDSRYSYDVASIDLKGDGTMAFRNKEVNQLNGKINYKFGEGEAKNKLGASAAFGGLYNLETEEVGNHYAFALHYELDVHHFNLKAQATTYGYQPRSPEGESKEQLALTAYGAPYLVAAKANTYTLGVAYTFPVKWNPVSSIQVYNDFGYMQKKKSDFDNSIMEVLGALVTAGQVFTYIDFAWGKNHSWLGQEWTQAFAEGAVEDPWGLRFNINIGYYF